MYFTRVRSNQTHGLEHKGLCVLMLTRSVPSPFKQTQAMHGPCLLEFMSTPFKHGPCYAYTQHTSQTRVLARRRAESIISPCFIRNSELESFTFSIRTELEESQEACIRPIYKEKRTLIQGYRRRQGVQN